MSAIQVAHRAQFLALLEQCPRLRAVGQSLADLPPVNGPYWLAAGCVVQSVWNTLSGRPSDYGILDYDIVFFDPDSPFAWARELEERLSQQHPELQFDVKNQAHVHHWFERRFGVPLPPYRSLNDAMATWPSTATATAIHYTKTHWEILAPFGLGDLLQGVVRPVKTLVSPDIYAQKSGRWKQRWPELKCLPFEQGLGPFEVNGPIDLPPVAP